MEIYHSTEEIEEVNQKSGLDYKYHQIGRTPYQGRFNVHQSDTLTLVEETSSSALEVHGSNSNDHYFFMLVDPKMSQGDVVVNGVASQEGAIYVLPPSSEMSVILKRPGRINQVSIEAEVINGALDLVAQDSCKLPSSSFQQMNNPQSFARLFNTITAAITTPHQHQHQHQQEIIDVLVEQQLSIYQSQLDEKNPVGRPAANYMSTINRVRDYLHVNATTNFTTQDLCRIAGTTHRNLDRVFKAYFGLSPKQYVIAYKLNKIRGELLAASPENESVSLVASKYQFHHLGRFAGQYFSYFNEFPNQTLRRSS